MSYLCNLKIYSYTIIINAEKYFNYTCIKINLISDFYSNNMCVIMNPLFMMLYMTHSQFSCTGIVCMYCRDYMSDLHNF